MPNEFSGTLYHSRSDMLYAMASEWITARGSNVRSYVTRVLRDQTDEALAAVAIKAWGLNVRQGEAAETHMDREGYDANDLAAAFARFREGFETQSAILAAIDKAIEGGADEWQPPEGWEPGQYDGNWEHPAATEARRLIAEAGIAWQFTDWADAREDIEMGVLGLH